MDWPVGVKAGALFSSDRALNIIDQNAPVWAFWIQTIQQD